jgi:hypothetical protein
MPPQNCSHMYNLSTIFFGVMHGHHILDFFYFYKVYLISFRLHLINYFEKFNKLEEIKHMEDIRNKIIPIIKSENLNIYFKIKVVDGILG